MKKLVSLILFLGYGLVLYGQEGTDRPASEGAQVVSASQAIQTPSVDVVLDRGQGPETVGVKVDVQVGVPVLGRRTPLGIVRTTNPLDIRFPWGVLYQYDTFADDFTTISKGYFGDKVRLEWKLRANQDLIKSFTIYRRVFSAVNPGNFQELATLQPTATEYNDFYLQGGVLYEYRIQANGISSEPLLYTNYIQGIGFRNPTATVTGNVFFDNGTPVKDVMVRATADGSSGSFGSALLLEPNTAIGLRRALGENITGALTYMAWFKPQDINAWTASGIVRLAQFTAGTGEQITLEAQYDTGALLFYVNGQTFTLNYYFPSGKQDNRGNDELLPVSKFHEQYNHISVALEQGAPVALYINGRPMTKAYGTATDEVLKQTGNASYTAPYFSVDAPATLVDFLNSEYFGFTIGGRGGLYYDELRVYNSVRTAPSILQDYRRYISGNNSNLLVYFRFNEGDGQYAYDLSRDGDTFNANDMRLWASATKASGEPQWVKDAGNVPETDQLGILGITNDKGNYEIAAIPYKGNGESFSITPIFGQHQFSPGQQLVYLGEGATVANKIDFTDISAFEFKGRVVYDVRGVFPSFVETNGNSLQGLTENIEYVNGPGILDEGYNYYEKSGVKYPKGLWWLNDMDTANPLDDRLERYAAVGLPGANVFINGDIVIDENKRPVVTDAEGNFSIKVPIGNHFISVRKNKHELVYGGRFPATSGSLKEFFEDAVEPVYFIDTTRVTMVGRVVGGPVEAEKPIGFGATGQDYRTYKGSTGIDTTVALASKNNIGIAELRMEYIPAGSPGSTPETRQIFRTNTETGEYRIKALPIRYQLNQVGGLRIVNNPALQLLTANEILELEPRLIDTLVPQYPNKDNPRFTGEAFNFNKSFVYRSTPELEVLSQTSDPTITIDAEGETISTEGFAYPVYSQFYDYSISLKAFERYTNFDGATPLEEKVASVDGELVVNNNLALPDSENDYNAPEAFNPDDASIRTYTFQGGAPSITPPFTRNISMSFVVNGTPYPVLGLKTEGLLLGGQPDGSQTFITEAPDVPDIILRDPPGSESKATIEAGSIISFKVNREVGGGVEADQNFLVKAGVQITVATGTPFLGVINETQGYIDVETGIKVENSSKTGNELQKTYTFTQTISTSDDPRFTGAKGDLYIGNSKNFYYGTFDNVQSDSRIRGNLADNLEMENTAGEKVYISKQKAMYLTEEPTGTLFIYSQTYILETLIPQLELFITNIDNGVITPGVDGAKTKEQYQEQIRLWRTIIKNNEQAKYRALKDRVALREEVVNNIGNYINDLKAALSEEESKLEKNKQYEERLNKRLANAEAINDLVGDNFEDNISFDSGVGEFSREIETSVVKSKTIEYTLDIDERVSAAGGFLYNKIGTIATTSGVINQNLNSTFTEEETASTKISYTLKDNDRDNALSVDVVNSFDGNGPIFSTLGGRTSCPYEPADLAYFFDPENPDSAEPLTKEVALSNATQQIEVPLISVEVAEVFDIPETQNAEFTLILENNSLSESDIYFELLVDNTTNPNNALINLPANGASVLVPYGEKTIYKLTLGKSISDVYDYEDISIILQSECDSYNIYDTVEISAHFVPSCSQVAVKAPLNDFTYNREQAFNLDGTSNPLLITLGDYNRSFNSFQKLDLEYRAAGSPTWTRLHTFYATQDFYDAALANAETGISLITESTVSYPFDITGLQLGDGNYELRSRSTCSNGTEFISTVVRGRVDLSAPQRFGTPTPIDGILSVGEDLKVRFSEPVVYNNAVSIIEIKGRTNQLPISNEVSLYFEGAGNTLQMQNPLILNNDLSLEFWLKNNTQAAAVLLRQEDGMQIALNGDDMSFTLGGVTATGTMTRDGLFHHYTLTFDKESGDLFIYEESRVMASNNGGAQMQIANNNDLVWGGNSFIGNLSQIRIWERTVPFEEAFANMYASLQGNEDRLAGYWPLDEGRGVVANDLARFKNAVINTSWDIKPKGAAYNFENGHYLELDNAGFAQLNSRMDATISFWVKTDRAQDATLFSNGKADGTDPVQSNGLTNKWAIAMNTGGNLIFRSEGISLSLTTKSIADNGWHHVALLLNRQGNLRTYIDGNQVSSNSITGIGGFSGNRVWLGARGYLDPGAGAVVDQKFTGKLDEFRLWNTLRNQEQIKRDAYEEVDPESIGLLLYARMNRPDPANGNGPRYFHAFSNNTVISSTAVLGEGAVNYTDDAPAIKPQRNILKFVVDRIINGDEMILEPRLNSWAEVEGQVLDITVARMFDSANNQQQSPITWTAFVHKNEVNWYAEGHSGIVNLIQQASVSQTFDIVLLNKGGTPQPFTIDNIPSWLSLSSTSGTLAPASQIKIQAKVDADLETGEYIQDLRLNTDFGYALKLQIDLRVLEEAPNWNVDPAAFDNSMNVVGKLKIGGVFSEDSYDLIAAFVNGEVRGVSKVTYDPNYEEYYVFLSVYSNEVSAESVQFKIWDASRGEVLQASLNQETTISFIPNGLIGSLKSPAIFENTSVVEQLLEFNKGWTWVSVRVEDSKLSNLNALTQGMQLNTSDRILSSAPAYLDTYYKGQNASSGSWSGTLSSNGGLSTSKMFKVNLAQQQSLLLTGPQIDLNNWSFNLQQNWNWLPYPVPKNVLLREALATYNPTDGDVIKSQSKFAIYDQVNGWSGTLTYLEEGHGYMIHTAKQQNFSYPRVLSKSSKTAKTGNLQPEDEVYFMPEYGETMSLVVQLPENYSDVYVYNRQGNLKGKTALQQIGSKELGYLTVFGEDIEELSFKVANASKTVNATTALQFRPNGVIGSVANPMRIEIEETIDGVIYPNPFSTVLSARLTVATDVEAKIQLFSLSGQLVFSEKQFLKTGMNEISINPTVSAGAYVFVITAGDQKIQSKVIKN